MSRLCLMCGLQVCTKEANRVTAAEEPKIATAFDESDRLKRYFTSRRYRGQRYLASSDGVVSSAIHAALRRKHGFAGCQSAVRRNQQRMRAAQPAAATVRLSFAPGKAAQGDFGAGPVLDHPNGRPRLTWAFVMTLAHSRQ